MLDAELADQPYSKTEHRNALRKIVHRSAGSIERKQQNISAVLPQLGLPWISGYKPLGNFQDSLVEVVEAKLCGKLAKLGNVARAPAAMPPDVSTIFVAPPAPAETPKGQAINRVIRKFDPAARDAMNLALGKPARILLLASRGLA